MADALEDALTPSGSNKLAEWGTIVRWPYDRVRAGDWSPAAFYDCTLAETAHHLSKNPNLAVLGSVAEIEPNGRAVRGAFEPCSSRQETVTLWEHKSNVRTSLLVIPNEYVTPKDNKHGLADRLWAKRQHLHLSSERVWWHGCRTLTVFTRPKCIGSVFVPVCPYADKIRKVDPTSLMKAWCVWGNSTPHILSLLKIRQKKLSYSYFSMRTLQELPFPDPLSENVDFERLIDAFEKIQSETLLPISQLCADPVRKQIDEAVCHSIPGLSNDAVAEWRDRISAEPTISEIPAWKSPK